MATPLKASVCLRFGAALVSCALLACASGGGDEPGAEPAPDGGKAGSGAAEPEPSAGGKSSSGGDDEPRPEAGTGSAGAPSEPGEGSGASGGRGGEDEPPEPAGGSGAGEPEPEPEPEPEGPSEAFLRGEALVERHGCATCHQASFSGFTVFPNITPDKTTGIGNWTDEQIALAIRMGVDRDGATMCPTMLRYDLPDAEMADVIAFLRGIPAVANKVASVCPGHGE